MVVKPLEFQCTMQGISWVTWSSLIPWIQVNRFSWRWEGTQNGASEHYLTCACVFSLSYIAVMGRVKFTLSYWHWETRKNNNCSSDWGMQQVAQEVSSSYHSLPCGKTSWSSTRAKAAAVVLLVVLCFLFQGNPTGQTRQLWEKVVA